ncbi:MAG: hypothetical protein ACKO96_30325, partial [Flammeovirgaceae bacterium]
PRAEAQKLFCTTLRTSKRQDSRFAPDYHTFLDIGAKRTTDLIFLSYISSVPIAMFVVNIDKLADP